MRSSGDPVIGSEAINVTVCSPPEEIGSCFILSSRLTRPVLFSRGTVVVTLASGTSGTSGTVVVTLASGTSGTAGTVVVTLASGTSGTSGAVVVTLASGTLGIVVATLASGTVVDAVMSVII